MKESRQAVVSEGDKIWTDFSAVDYKKSSFAARADTRSQDEGVSVAWWCQEPVTMDNDDV